MERRKKGGREVEGWEGGEGREKEGRREERGKRRWR